MLQVFHIDIAKVDQDVAYVASASEACCKCFRGFLRAFVQNVFLSEMYVARVFYLDVAHVSHICCKSIFKMFQMFQSYVAISVFMLQVVRDVAYVSHTCCKSIL
jgi:hypothetical protein